MRSAVAVLTLASVATCAAPAALPPPSAGSSPGVIRVWGNAQADSLTARWEAGFRKTHPDIRIRRNMTGSDIGMAGLYTGQADVALLGREATESEQKAYEWIFGAKPMQIEIMTGSRDRAGKSPALVVFVHKDNPLSRLTLAQLEAIFGHEHRRSDANIETWGQLGLGGQWADRVINLYGPVAESGTGKFFRATVLGDSNRMNWEHLTEFEDKLDSGSSVDDSARRILGALAADRDGMAIGNLQFANASVKPLALSVSESARPQLPDERSLIERTYPLTRSVYAYIGRGSDSQPDPQVRAFLRYVLSEAGQRDIRAEGGYLPLSRAAAREQLERLD